LDRSGKHQHAHTYLTVLQVWLDIVHCPRQKADRETACKLREPLVLCWVTTPQSQAGFRLAGQRDAVRAHFSHSVV